MKITVRIVFFCLILTVLSCGKKEKVKEQQQDVLKYSFDLQGHRGARGLAPENTMAAFKKALELGVNTLELDVVVSQDKQLVVSHESWFNAALTITPAGEDMEEEKKPSTNFFQMKYEDIRKYDCGSREHPNFPEQELQESYKPLLSEVLQMVEDESQKRNIIIHYNIEIKSLPEGDNIFHPEPSEYCKLVVDLVTGVLPFDRFTIQSFDFRILRELHQKHPQIKLAALVAKKELELSLEELGFVPNIFSPNFTMVDSIMMVQAHHHKVKVIPWTVNQKSDMKRLLQLGVDGLITDYPNRALVFRK